MPDRRTIPQDIDAEMNVLGSMMIQPEVIDEVRPILTADAFAVPQHGLIFAAVLAIHDRGDPVELLPVEAELRSRGKLDETGGREFLIQLAESFSDPASVGFYARTVRRCYRRRRLIRVGERLKNEAYGDGTDVDALIAETCTRLDKIDVESLSDRDAIAEPELLRGMRNPSSVEGDRVPVGLGHLGELLDGGLDRGTLTSAGGRPATGKTSLGLGLALHAAESSDGCPALFVSAEMSVEQVAQRLLSMRSRLEVHRIRSGIVDDEQFIRERNKAALDAEASVNAGRGVFILEGVTDCRLIAAHIRRSVRKRGIRLAIVDYLGRLSIAGKYDRHDLRLAAMTKLFKDVAVECEIAVVLLVQLSRASEKENRRPTLADLRDSGAIEADSDNVILIHRGKDTPDALSDTTLILAKQRQGRTGDCPVWYCKPVMSYEAQYIRVSEGAS